MDGEWLTVAPCVRPEDYVARPDTWSGEGRPPVGTVCETTYDDGKYRWGYWLKTKVLAYGEQRTFVSQETRGKPGEWIEGGICSEGMKYRPIRTPEQIAAEERKAAIDKMAADAQLDFSAGELLSAREYVECAIAALHDAGYRKQEAP